jgi:glycosyltransferase involved in cell wall biosynthesis
MPDILIFSALIPRICGSKVILDLHDPMPEVYMTKYSFSASHPVVRLLIFFEKLSIWFSSLVLTPNIAFRDLFVSRGCPEFKIQVVMNSPDQKIFSFSSKCNKNEDVNNGQFSLMYHGTIVERHGLDIALKTLNKVRNKIPNIVFHVYGKGEFVESFLMLIEQLELDDMVFYHGQVSHETIAKEIESIDVGLIPNKRSPFTDINMPTRIFEYLCKGKPVIAPRTKGILDYFDEESLCFFEPGSAESLAKVIFEAYSNPERRYEVLERGIAVYKKYRWELQREYFLSQVKNLLDNNDSQSNRAN